MTGWGQGSGAKGDLHEPEMSISSVRTRTLGDYNGSRFGTYHSLAHEELLRNGGRQTTKEVAPAIHDDSLRRESERRGRMEGGKESSEEGETPERLTQRFPSNVAQ